MATLGIQQKIDCDHAFLSEGSVKSAAASTLVDTKKNWPLNLWAGAKVTIFSGKGKGQTVGISGNTATTLFLSGLWTTIPDITSLYRGLISSERNYCPKCNGSDSYRDISFVGGRVKVVSGINKLAQSLETAVETHKGSSIFNPEIGSGLELVLDGELENDEEVIAFVERNVNLSLQVLANSQNEAVDSMDFERDELFGQLIDLNINIPETLPTVLEVFINSTSASEEDIPVTSPLLVR